MKYRVVGTSDEFDVITEDGGVASVHHNGENFLTTYYQSGLTDHSDLTRDNLWEKLGEGKCQIKDWDFEADHSVMVADALEWLVFPQPDEEWELDDTLFQEFFG